MRPHDGDTVDFEAGYIRHLEWQEAATVNATADERDSDLGGGAVFHDNRVRVDKTS